MRNIIQRILITALLMLGVTAFSGALEAKAAGVLYLQASEGGYVGFSSNPDQTTVRGESDGVPSGFLNLGRTVSFTVYAAAKEGYEFVGWSENNSSILNSSIPFTYSWSFTPNPWRDNEKTLYAIFKKKHTISANMEVEPYSADAGTVKVGSAAAGQTSSTTALTGSQVTFVATAKNGYEFLGWYDESGTKKSGATSYTYTVGDSDYKLTAKYIKSFSVTATMSPNNSNYGSVRAGDSSTGTSSTKSGNYNSTITLKATPKTGYDFIGWYDGDKLLSTDASYDYTIPDHNSTVTAKFEPHKYTISANMNPSDPDAGTVQVGSAAPGLTSVTTATAGSKVTFVATVKDGYTFDGWYNGNSRVTKNASYTYTVSNSNYTLTAKYTIKSFSVKATMSPNNSNYGSVQAGDSRKGTTSTKSGNYKSIITLTATPNTGYDFIGWYDGDKLLSTDASYNYAIPDHDSTVTAKFEKHTYSVNVTVKAGDDGIDSVSAGKTLTWKTGDEIPTLQLTASLKTGFEFDYWYIENSETSLSNSSSYSYKPTTSTPSKITVIAKSKPKTVKFTGKVINSSWGYVYPTGNMSSMGASFVVEGPWNQPVDFNAVAAEHYDFVGWATDNAGRNIISTDLHYSTASDGPHDLTLYAVFKPKTYTVNISVAAGDSGIESVSGGGSISWTYGDTIPSVSLETVIKFGNLFDGWYIGDVKVAANAVTSYAPTENKNATITIVAKSKPVAVPFTLIVDPANVGNLVAAQGSAWMPATLTGSVNVSDGKISLDIAGMPSSNYEFLGWYLADGTALNLVKYEGMYYSDTYYVSYYEADYTPGMSIELYAKFRRITRNVTVNTSSNPAEGGYTYVISANGDSWASAGSSKTAIVREGSMYNFNLRAVAASGYSFVGWYLNGTFISNEAEIYQTTAQIYDDTLIEYVAVFTTRPKVEITTTSNYTSISDVCVSKINDTNSWGNNGNWGKRVTVSEQITPPESVQFRLATRLTSKNQYVFRGWLINTTDGEDLIEYDSYSNGTSSVSYYKTITLDEVSSNLTQTYYAIYKPKNENYKVNLTAIATPSIGGTVSLQGSTYRNSVSTEITAGNANNYSVTFRLAARTESGYRFEGWYDGEGNLLSTQQNFDYIVSKVIKAKSLTVYARFTSAGGATPTPTPGATSTPTPTPILTETALRILEIEPYASYLTDAEWKTTLGNLYGANKYKVAGSDFSVRRMTTGEFIVNNDDLTSSYDLIYFGMKTGSYYTNTIYPLIQSDSSFPNSLIYSHVGPVNTVKSSRKGGLAPGMSDVYISSRIKTRTSGNDITVLRRDEIINFVKGSGSVIFANGFLDSGNAINRSKIDSSSVLYELVATLKSNYASGCVFYKDGALTTSERTNLESRYFSKYCRIKQISVPKQYTDSGRDEDRYINGANSTYRTLSFTFTIEDKSSIQDPFSYYLGLYIDLNADGRYNSSDEETLSGLTIYDSTMGQYVEEGNYLYSWHTYIVSRDISEIVGVVPWMLKVARVEGITLSEVSDTIQGYSAIKARPDERETIRVLQIYQGVGVDSQSFSANGYEISYMLPTTDDLINIARRKNSSFNVNDYKKADGSFELERLYAYFKANITAADFRRTDIVLYDSAGSAFYFNTSNSGATTLNGKNSRGEYTSISVTGVNNRNAANTTAVTAKFYELYSTLNEFLICTDRMSAQSYEHYVATGHSLLDEYDMIILGFGDGYADFNNAACLDINRFINAGRTVLFTHDTTSFNQSNGNYTGDWVWGYNINSAFRSKLAMDRFNVKDKNGSLYTSDVAKLGGVTITDSNQGFTDTMSDGNVTTTIVDRVNRGTLTEYPFTLPDRITVGSTHPQYYQLDMENPNVVVWYSLASNSSSSIFNQNPKDARNYYYIYNVGNITYSGAGHYLGTATDVLNELKLFVNTVVAAYRASGTPVDTIITNDDKTSGDKFDYLYVDFDSTDTQHALGDGISYNNNNEYKLVTFTVEDNSIINTTGIKVNYYILTEDEDGNEVAEAFNVDTYEMKPDRSFGTAVPASAPNAQGIKYYTVRDEVEYGFNLNLENLAEGSSLMIKIVTTITYGSEATGDLIEVPTNKYVEIIRRGFFDLD